MFILSSSRLYNNTFVSCFLYTHTHTHTPLDGFPWMSRSIMIERPFLIIQRTGGSSLEPSCDAMEMIGMTTGTEGHIAFVCIVRFCSAGDA